MRSKNELIDLVIEKMKNEFYIGICRYIPAMANYKEITEDEYHFLIDLVKSNRPKITWSENYFFFPFENTPRIEFLNNLKDKS